MNYLLFFKLRVVERVVEAALFEQLLMTALFDDVAVLHNEDDVAFLDGREPVCDNKARPALHHLGERLLNADLGEGIDRRGRLVENQHARVGQHGARNTEQLLLTLTQVAAALADFGVVAVGHSLDEAVCVRGFSRRDNLLVGSGFVAVTEVFHDRAAEKPAVLEHHAVAAAQSVAAEVADIGAVEQYSALVHLVKAHEQIDERGFAAAGGTDYRNVEAARHLEREVLYQRFFGNVGEAHVLDRDPAPAVIDGSFALVGGLVSPFEDLKDPLGGGDSGVELGQHACDLVERLGVLVGVGEEARQTADAQTARNYGDRAENCNGCVNKGVYKPRARIGESACELSLEADRLQLAVQFVKALEGARLIRKRLDELLISNVLLDKRGYLALQNLLFGKAAVGQLADKRREEQRKRSEQKDRDGDSPVDRDHKAEGADDCDNARKELQNNLSQTVAHGVDVVDNAADKVAVRICVDG